MKNHINVSRLLYFACLFGSLTAQATSSIPAMTITDAAGTQNSISINLQIIAVMTALTLLPALILTMTSFTRVVIVLAILRQAMGMPQTPSNQIIIGLSLFLTFFIMAPIFETLNEEALQPYLKDSIPITEAFSRGAAPIKAFMLTQTRKMDISVFREIAGESDAADEPDGEQVNPDSLPLKVLIPAFLTSELKTAFQIGFLLFIPFLVIDLVVASVLMAMGMMMLSPLIISLPFKIMLFILIDGWTLVMSTLTSSFGVV